MTHTAMGVLYMLAAEQDLHRVWGRFDHQRPADGMNQMLVLVGMAALLIVTALIWFRAARRSKSQFVSDSPRKLFRELCRAHGLGFSSRRMLRRLAAARGLPSAALLFVEPEHFDPTTLPASLQRAATDLQRLRAQLFG